jgi:hypothetical protein
LNWSEERRLLRIEMLLDSATQSKEIDPKKVREALAHVRVIRNQRIEKVRRGKGWQLTLTQPNLPKDTTPEKEVARFGHVQRKRWEYNVHNQIVPMEVAQVS